MNEHRRWSFIHCGAGETCHKGVRISNLHLRNRMIAGPKIVRGGGIWCVCGGESEGYEGMPWERA